MPVNYSKLSRYRIKKLLHCFGDELTAVQAARQVGINRNTADRFYTIFRERIAAHQEAEKKQFMGNVEIDESYFGSARRGDKRGRAVGRKIPVVGILKRSGAVYTEIIPDVSRKTLVPIIEKLVQKSKSNVYTDK